jgi:hypothetical protein
MIASFDIKDFPLGLRAVFRNETYKPWIVALYPNPANPVHPISDHISLVDLLRLFYTRLVSLAGHITQHCEYLPFPNHTPPDLHTLMFRIGHKYLVLSESLFLFASP